MLSLVVVASAAPSSTGEDGSSWGVSCGVSVMSGSYVDSGPVASRAPGPRHLHQPGGGGPSAEWLSLLTADRGGIINGPGGRRGSPACVGCRAGLLRYASSEVVPI